MTGTVRDARAGWWRYYLVVVAAVMAVAEATLQGWASAVFESLIAFATVGAIIGGVRMHRPRRPSAWYLMAAGQTMWGIAGLVYAFDGRTQEPTFPSAADVVALAGYPLIIAGLFWLIRGRNRWSDSGGLLDAAIIMVALSLLVWVYVAQPSIADYGAGSWAGVIAAAYPMADIALIAFVVRVATSPGGVSSTSTWLLAASVMLILVGDVTSTLSGNPTYGVTGAEDQIWLLAYVALGAAALHPSMAALSESNEATTTEMGHVRLIAMTGAVLVGPAVSAAKILEGGGQPTWAILLAAAAIGVLVVARMAVGVREVQAAHRQRDELRAELAHRAAHDDLTGLVNRPETMRLVTAALSRARRSGTQVGVLFIDLDGFKLVNDGWGHDAGDVVLRTTAERMQVAVRGGDIVGRLGGDEFVVLLEPVESTDAAVLAGERLIDALSAPISIGVGREVRVGASVGVALGGADGTDAETLLREADAALYRVKRSGRGAVGLFDDAMREELVERRRVERALREAVDSDGLVVRYGPIVEVASGAVVGLEAAAHWPRAGGEPVARDEFLGLVAEPELVCDIETWILRRVARDVAGFGAERGDAEHDGLWVSVPVSPRHLLHSRFPDDVRGALGAGLEPRRLVLAVPEQTLVSNDLAVRHLREVCDLGVRASVDRFHTAPTSVARLEALPVDQVRIESKDLSSDSPLALRRLRLLVEKARTFDVASVATGVEREEQLDVLRELDCDFAEGPLIGAPTSDPRWVVTAMSGDDR